jgi:hypothetical protein
MRSVSSILFAVALAIGTSGSLSAQQRNDRDEQWFRAKFGRSSPAEEARKKADRSNTAFREDTDAGAVSKADDRTEQYFQSKLGRSSPAEEARKEAERSHTAYREDKAAEAAPAAVDRTDQYMKAKLGRGVARGQKAAGN